VDISFTVCNFVCLFVCTVTDFSAEDKALGVKFCRAVKRHARAAPFVEYRAACGRRIGMCG